MGGIVRTITGKPSSDEMPDRDNYGNPYAEELMARVLGAIDRYNEKRGGIKQYIPRENWPYEMRPDEERAAIREREKEDAADDDRPARRLGINEPDENDPTYVEKSKSSKEMVQEKQAAAQESGEQEEDLSDVFKTADPERRRRTLNAMLKTSKYRPNFTRKRSQERDDSDLLGGG